MAYTLFIGGVAGYLLARIIRTVRRNKVRRKFKFLLYIRHWQDGAPKSKTVLINEYPSESADALGLAPIVLDGPYRIIFANNHLN